MASKWAPFISIIPKPDNVSLVVPWELTSLGFTSKT